MLPLGRRERSVGGRLLGRGRAAAAKSDAQHGRGRGWGSVCGLLVWGLLASLLTVAPVGVGPAGAQSSALVSNVGQASTGHQSLGRDAAQAFTTGGNSGGYTVDSVDVQFVQLSDTAVFGSKVTVTINSDSGGSPGAVVDALTNPVFVATNSERNYTFAAPAGGVWLEANTTYWLVLDSDGTQQGNNRIRFTALDGEDAGAAAGWSIGDTSIWRSAGSTGGWTSWNSSMKIDIAGSANTPPTANPDGSFTVPFSWPLRPASVGPDGGDFRLLFLTQGTRDATSSDIADYDAFVQASASGSHPGGAHSAIRPYASLFKAAASTATVNARVHTGMDWTNPSHLDAPIHWLGGSRLSPSNVFFWASDHQESWSSSDRRNAAGVAPTGSVLNSNVWTGTRNGGFVTPSGPLGDSDGTSDAGRVGGVPGGNSFWYGVPTSTSTLLPLYGVSPVFRVLPAPALNAAGSVDVPEGWPLLPEGVPPGGEFRLMFSTADTRDATASDISVYDEFVRRSAAGLHSGGAHDAIKPYAARFKALASTSSVDARTHLGMDPNDATDRDVPVFWLDGGRTAANSSGFWSSSWSNSATAQRRSAAGQPTAAAFVWTGTNADGSKHASLHLGASGAEAAAGNNAGSDPVFLAGTSKSMLQPLYGVSPVFRRPLKPTAAGSYVVPYDWVLKPSGLNPGDEFRLLFVTADTRDASATDIGTYDSFVQSSVRGGHTGGAHQAVLSYASLFKAVGSTSTVDARTHLGMDPNVSGDADVAVYWLNGSQAAASNSGFWSTSWTNSAQAGRRTAAGSAPSSAVEVWTGTQVDGAKAPMHHLGSEDVISGSNSNTHPLTTDNPANSSSLRLYGVSGVFRVGNPYGTELSVRLIDGGGNELDVFDEDDEPLLNFNFNADADVVPAGGLDLGSLLSAVPVPQYQFLGASDVPKVLAVGAADSANVGLRSNSLSDSADTPDREVVYVYRNEPALPVTPVDGRFVWTVRDNDPTLVDLTTTAPSRSDLFEGSSVKFAVSLSRSLVTHELAGETVVETVAVPIVVDGGTTSDYTITLDSAAANTGVTFDAASGVLLFTGQGAQNAGLVFTAAADGTAEAGAEPMRVALGADTVFDGLSATNVGGGADPVLTTDSVPVPKGFTVDVFDVPAPAPVVRVPFEWDLKPDSVAAGGRFRLLFLTQDTRDATSTDIADYDSFVQASAAGDHTGGAHDAIRGHASSFKALGSTGSVFAFEHLRMHPDSPHDPDVAVFWLNGSRVAAGSDTFWADTWENWGSGDRRNAAGSVPSGATETAFPFTGTHHGGRTASPDANRLGAANSPFAANYRVSGSSRNPVGDTAESATGTRPFYGVSPVFEVQAPAVRIVDVPHDWALNPDGVEAGDEYRLMFVTQQRRDARSSDIGVYDAFVRASASGSSAHEAIRPFARSFKALGSTGDVDARDHLGMNPNVEHHRDVPVYWLGGARAAAGNANVFGTRISPQSGVGWESVGRHASGAVVPSQRISLNSRATYRNVWTGTRNDGTAFPTLALGATEVYVGRADPTINHIREYASHRNDRLSLYGVSPVFRVGAPPDLTVSTCEAGADCGSGVVFVEEGATAVVRVDLGHELTGSQSTDVTAASSDSAGVLLRGPDSLWLGYWRAQPCTVWTYDTYVRYGGARVLLPVQVGADRVDADGYATVTVTSADGFKQESRVKLDAHWYEECQGRRGRKVQSQAILPDTPEGSVTYREPSASIGFGFDAADWAGYTSEVYTTRHKGWREIVVHAPRRCTTAGTVTPQSCGGPDRVYDLTLTSTDTDVSLPSVKVVVTPGLGRRDPQLTPHCPNERCLTVTEGASATYTVRNHIVPKPGEPITVTPRVIEGAGVTVSPASASWTSTDDFLEPRTFTVTAAHDDDVHARDASFRIGHDFSDSYVTDGRLEDGEDRNETWFNLAGTVVDDDKLTLSVTPVDGDSTLDEISLNSGTGGTASFEVHLSGPLVDCAGRDYPEDCAESLFVKLQTVVSRTRVPTDGVVTMVTRTVGGVQVTEAACDMNLFALTRHRQAEAAAGRSTAGLTCENRVVYDRAPFTASVAGSSHYYEHRHTVTADNADIPVRVDLAMVSGIGTSGSYDIVVSLTGYWDHTHTALTVPVAYGPSLISTNTPPDVPVDPPTAQTVDPPTEQTVDQVQVTDIAVTHVTGSTATIAWPTGGDGTQYQIGWYPTKGVPRLKYASTAQTSHTITGLQPESGYKVFVIASHGAEILQTHSITVTTLPDGQTRHATIADTTPVDRQPLTDTTDPPDPPAVLPVVTITAGADITEGSPATFTVTADPAPTTNLPVTVTITATGDHTTAVGTRTVTVPAGTTSTNFAVATTDDHVDETDGTVTATINTGGGYTVSTTHSAATVAVADDDDPVVVPTVPETSITATGGVVEGSSASFTVTADPAPTTNLPVTVTVTQTGDHATAVGTRTVTITAGTTSATFTIATTNDHVDETDGTITATINTHSSYTVAATAGTATVDVEDDDTPEISITTSAGTGVTEGNPAGFTVTADTAPHTNLDITVTVTATGDHGAATGARTVTIAAGTTSTGFSVATAGDHVDEADGTITATLDAPASDDGYTVTSTAGTATVDVEDDDTPEISISAGTGVTEGNPAGFTVTADPAPHADLDVTVTVTATGDHGAAAGTRTVTVPAGATSAGFSVATTGDHVDEADGTITATLDAPPADAGYTVTNTTSTATVTVEDDDTPEISISADTAAVTEGNPASFTLTADPAPHTNLDVTITVTATGDHGATTGARTVTVPAGATSTAFTVTTTNDHTDEPDGTITATLDTPPADAGYTIPNTTNNAAVTITDNDDPPTTLTITINDASTTEGDKLTFQITLSHAPTQQTRISWNTATAWHIRDNRAHTNDYQQTYGTITFKPGQTTATAQIWTEHDNHKEPDEHFAIEAYLPGNWRHPDATATMTITNND